MKILYLAKKNAWEKFSIYILRLVAPDNQTSRSYTLKNNSNSQPHHKQNFLRSPTLALPELIFCFSPIAPSLHV